MTLYCILKKLADWRHQHDGAFPEQIFVQCDGGSENANRYLLALLEFMVIKRMAKRIILTRLPKGHIHDDMDAVFGLLWKWMSSRIIETVEQFKIGVEEAFSHLSSRLKVKVKFIDVLPDYQSFFADSIDNLLSRYTKEQQTQHRWSFEAVQSCSEFPFGVKTMYRAYASDKVVEITKIAKEDCVTDIGRLTGLEPRTTFSLWYPRHDSISNRLGTEGFYLLTKVPYSNDIAPSCFDEDGVRQFEILHKKIKQLWPRDDSKRQWWDHFMSLAPKGTVFEHLLMNPGVFNVPLHQFFKRTTFNRSTRHWFITRPINTDSLSIPWPTELSLCMPSVVTTFNRHPGPSRIFATDDDITNTRIAYYSAESVPYYESLKASTVGNLIEFIIKVRLTNNGELIHNVDTKTMLINAIKRDDVQFFKRQFRNLNDESKYLVDTKLNQEFYHLDHENMNACSITVGSETKTIKFKDFRSLGYGKSVSPTVFDFVQLRLQKKEKSFHQSFDDHYKDSRSYKQLVPNLYLPSIKLFSLLQDSLTLTRDWNSMKHFRYLVLPIIDESLYWFCVFVDENKQSIFVGDPLQRYEDNIASLQLLASLNKYFKFPDQHWSKSLLPTLMIAQDVCRSLEDSGITLLAIIIFFMQSVPLHYNQYDIEIFRFSLCFDLLINNHD